MLEEHNLSKLSCLDWAQLFLIPAKIIKVIERICRSYLWSGVGEVTKKALIAWEKVCCPKSEGGIGLINMKIWNRAAIAKLCWDLANKEDKFGSNGYTHII